MPQPVWAYLAVAAGSWFALKAAYGSLKEGSVDVNLLMAFAAGASVALGHPAEAAVLLFLFSLSGTLETYAMSKTRSAIEGLIKLRPDSALMIGPNGDREVPVEELRIGDHVRVVPFARIPADGRVISGESSIDQQVMTGESQPIWVREGDHVLAGTQNLESMLVIEIEREQADSTLHKIVDLVRDAQENKASGERISQWFGQKYTFFVLGVFFVALAVRTAIGQSWDEAAYASLTLLVALSPCALVISTPASTLSALAWGARNGILIRGGEFIEKAAQIDIVALDKTGTLTNGRPELSEICLCTASPVVAGSARTCVEESGCWYGSSEMTDEARRVLRLSAAAEQYSSHPIAQAILNKARAVGIEVPEATEVVSQSGLGVIATVDGQRVRIGHRRFFESENIPLPPEFLAHAEELQAKGMTVAILESGDSLAALGLEDSARPEAPKALDAIRRQGAKRLALLTGDTRQTAEAIGKPLEVDEIHAALLPEHKTEIIGSWVDSGKSVMMLGDGVNDAPALAKATIGVAMGGLGSDIALNAADVVLMQDRLDRIAKLMALGKMASRIIRANLIFATGVILFLAIGSFVVDQVAPQWRHSLLPLAVVGHEGSTVIVILNGLRLLSGPPER